MAVELAGDEKGPLEKLTAVVVATSNPEAERARHRADVNKRAELVGLL